jgi:hypothetical protein
MEHEYEHDILASGFQLIGRLMIILLLLQCVLIRQAGYLAWSYITAGLLLTWIIWMIGGIIWETNRVPGNPVYLFILSLVGIFAWHLIADQYIPQIPKSGLLGSVNMSMLFHLVLIALSVLLSQCFFGYGSPPKRLFDVIAVIIMVGTLVVTFRGYSETINATGVLCFCGICIWLVPLTRKKRAEKISLLEPRPSDSPRYVFRLFVAAAVLVLLLVATQGREILWGLAVGYLPAIAYCTRKSDKPLLAKLIIVLGIALTIVAGLITASLNHIPITPLGMGEKGFYYVSAADSGLSLIMATTGYVGMSCFAIGTVGLALWSLFRIFHTRYASGSVLIRATLWVAAVLFSTAGLLVPGGYVNPVNVIVFGFVWGMLPRMTGVTPKLRSAWIPGLVVMCVVVTAGVVSGSGLLVKMSLLHHWGDKGMHFIGGGVVGILLGWWFGSKRRWLGIVGIVIAVLIGGAGELGQKLYTTRSFEWADWKYHTMGVAVALVLYILAVGCCLVMTPQRKLYWPKNDFVVCAGWFSRLMLLSVTLGFLLFWGAGMLISIATVWTQPKPTFIISDLVGVESEYPSELVGITNYSITGKINTLLSTSSGNTNPQMARQRHRKEMYFVFPRLGKLAPGFYQVSIKGTPFGPFAYDKQEASALIVTKPQGICLLDMRDILRWEKDSHSKFREMMKLLQKRGKIVFVHPGTAKDYEKNHVELKKLFPDIPFVCALTPESGQNRTLSDIAWMLQLTKQSPDPPEITAVSSDQSFIDDTRSYFKLDEGKFLTTLTIGKDEEKNPVPSATTLSESTSPQRGYFTNLSSAVDSLRN